MRTVVSIGITLTALMGPTLAVQAGCGGGDSVLPGGSTTSTTASAGGGGAASTGGHGGSPLGGAGGSAGGHGGAAQGGGGGHGGAGVGGGGVAGGGGGGVAGGGGGVAGGGGALDAGAADADAGPIVWPIVKCLNQVYQCGDGTDNDGDGRIDSADPDCLGPCDNTEDSFYGGIPGQAGPACGVDCYFDSNSGSGDDNCYWNHKCDVYESSAPGHPEPQSKCAYDPNANISGTPETCAQLSQAQSQACHDFCGPLTPNGCDCFGCCELPAGGGQYVWLGSTDPDTKLGTCTLAVLSDADKCQPCTPVPGCLNTCEACELCIGKDQVPPQCLPDGGPDGGAGLDGGAVDGGGAQCSPGVQACGLAGQPPCPYGFYCITGCCQLHI